MVGCAEMGTNSHVSSPPPPPGQAAPKAPAADVKFAEGDLVKITFDASTNLNTIAKVQLDGSITLPLVGDVKASGKTVPELRSALMTQYASLLKGEEITVSLAASTSSFYISGAVLRPGRFSMERPLTVMDAIMEAGGFDYNRAKPSAVVVFRIEGGKQQRYKVDMQKVLRGETKEVFYLKPFDTIHVPEKTFNF